MKIFVIGNSKSGKSTIANKLGLELGYKVISAGAWVRSAFGEEKPTRKEMDDYSCAVLNKNQNICIEYLIEQIGEEENVIIEGIRNPRDFMFLYQPGDIVIFIKLLPEIEESEFEKRGMETIQKYLEFVSLTTTIDKADIVIDTSIEGDVVKYAASLEQIYASLKIRFNGLFVQKSN